MEAPKKIYVDANESWLRTFVAFTDKAKGNDIEYIRKDIFIEEAWDWIEDNLLSSEQLNRNYSSKFRKAMEK